MYIAPGTYFKFGPFQTCREDFRVCLVEAVLLAVHRKSSREIGAQEIFFKWGAQGMPESSEAEKLVALGTSLLELQS